MPDVFGRVDQVFAGGLSADALFMTFPGLPGEGIGLLIQDISSQYTQPLRRIFELGPGIERFCSDIIVPTANACCLATQPQGSFHAQFTYYVVGRPEGRIQIGRIFGFTTIGTAFYCKYGNPCDPNIIKFDADIGCNGRQTEKQVWIMNGFVIDGLAMTVNAQDMLIQERLNGQFVSLTMNP